MVAAHDTRKSELHCIPTSVGYIVSRHKSIQSNALYDFSTSGICILRDCYSTTSHLSRAQAVCGTAFLTVGGNDTRHILSARTTAGSPCLKNFIGSCCCPRQCTLHAHATPRTVSTCVEYMGALVSVWHFFAPMLLTVDD